MSAGAAAAAAQMQRMREEEEERTRYMPADDQYEFKILRAATRAFRDPTTLRQVCQEEAQSGWVLVEKFDDSRLRFKRPLTARDQPVPLGVDPYRTTYGIGSGAMGFAIFCAIMSVCLVFMFVVMALSKMR